MPVLSKNHQIALMEAVDRICRVFWGPNIEHCREMRAGSFFRPFEQLDSVLEPESGKTLQQIKIIVRDFDNEELLYQHLAEAFVRLFINAREGIKAPLYQSCYEYDNASLMGKPAVDMKKRLEAKGLRFAEEIKEPPDHLSIALEYLYFLLDKGWSPKNSPLIAEAGSFAAEEMLPWVSEFAKRLQRETSCLFYPLLSSLLVSLLSLIAGFRK